MIEILAPLPELSESDILATLVEAAQILIDQYGLDEKLATCKTAHILGDRVPAEIRRNTALRRRLLAAVAGARRMQWWQGE